MSTTGTQSWTSTYARTWGLCPCRACTVALCSAVPHAELWLPELILSDLLVLQVAGGGGLE